jgi:hypothetical protein
MYTNKDLIEAIKLFVKKDRESLPSAEDASTTIKVVKEEPPIKIRIREPLTIFLKIRRTLDNKYIIYDHPLYDIIIDPAKNKILTFSKKNANFESYPSQDSFFDFLLRRGMLNGDSVQGGNIYGSLEAKYPVNEEVDTIEVLLLLVYTFLKDEVSDIKNIINYDEDVQERVSDPDDEESTEYGEIPHRDRQGSIDPGYRPYGLIYRI